MSEFESPKLTGMGLACKLDFEIVDIPMNTNVHTINIKCWENFHPAIFSASYSHPTKLLLIVIWTNTSAGFPFQDGLRSASINRLVHYFAGNDSVCLSKFIQNSSLTSFALSLRWISSPHAQSNSMGEIFFFQVVLSMPTDIYEIKLTTSM